MTSSAPPLETCGEPDELRLTARSSASLTFETTMRCRGLLVASETYFPGWNGYVDGQPAPLHEVYGALRGIVVSQGRHRVEMRYRPLSVYWGAALTLAGLLAALAAAIHQARRPDLATPAGPRFTPPDPA
ncbi:MAG: YfhO family protein [Paludibaculum sp.]